MIKWVYVYYPSLHCLTRFIKPKTRSTPTSYNSKMLNCCIRINNLMMKYTNIYNSKAIFLLGFLHSFRCQECMVNRLGECMILLLSLLICTLLYFSYFLYPSKKWGGGDSCEDDAASSGDGKYELLSVTNKLIAEEIRNVMSKSKRKAVFLWRLKLISFVNILKWQNIKYAVQCWRLIKINKSSYCVCSWSEWKFKWYFVGWIPCQSSLLYPLN